MALKLITPPAPIVTWGEADAHLKLDGDVNQRPLVEAMIAAATQYLDGSAGILGRALGVQTWTLYLDRFPCDAIQVPLPPLIQVNSVIYDDPDGAPQTIGSSNYEVDDKSVQGWIVPASSFSWPAPLDAINVVRVEFQAGYASVPAPLKAAILLMTADLFEQRESFASGILSRVPMSVTVDALLFPYRASFFG